MRQRFSVIFRHEWRFAMSAMAHRGVALLLAKQPLAARLSLSGAFLRSVPKERLLDAVGFQRLSLNRVAYGKGSLLGWKEVERLRQP